MYEWIQRFEDNGRCIGRQHGKPDMTFYIDGSCWAGYLQVAKLFQIKMTFTTCNKNPSQTSSNLTTLVIQLPSSQTQHTLNRKVGTDQLLHPADILLKWIGHSWLWIHTMPTETNDVESTGIQYNAIFQPNAELMHILWHPNQTETSDLMFLTVSKSKSREVSSKYLILKWNTSQTEKTTNSSMNKEYYHRVWNPKHAKKSKEKNSNRISKTHRNA